MVGVRRRPAGKGPRQAAFAGAVILALAVGLAESDESAAPGTAKAAELAAAAFVSRTSTDSSVQVNDEPKIAGDKALVRAVYGASKGCTVGVVRNPSDAKYGWSVQSSWCFTGA